MLVASAKYYPDQLKVVRVVPRYAFRKIYSLQSEMDALTPMPEDGGYWSTLHSSNSLGLLGCSLTLSIPCTQILVQAASVWWVPWILGRNTATAVSWSFSSTYGAYHSARKMVYMDPRTSSLSEQHPIELRRGFMWAKYLNYTRLKSMDEDLAEITREMRAGEFLDDALAAQSMHMCRKMPQRDSSESEDAMLRIEGVG